MRRCVVTIVSIILLSSFVGCGKEESASSSASSDPNVPMAGSAPTKSTQFVGKWVAITEGAIQSMEFMSDGKVLLTDVISRQLGAGKTLDYKVLEGGRLSMIAPDGLTAVYDVKFSGDQFEIRGELVISDNGMQRFRKLKSGETVESVLKAEAEARAKAYQERVAAVQAFLKQPKLVLSMGTGTNRSIAMDITPAGQGFTGKAWHEGNPPHLDEISGQVTQDDRDQTIALRVNFGRQLDPPVAGQSGGGGVTLNAAGEGSNLKLTGKAQFGSGGTPFEIWLKPDEAAHASAVKMFETEIARIAAMKKPIIDAIKDYAVLTGESGVAYNAPNMPTATDDRIVLIKGPQPGIWVGQGGLTDRRVGRVELLQNVTAVVDVLNNKPMLIINSLQRQYQFTIDSTGKKLEGGWFPPGNPQGKAAEYTIVESLDSAGRAAQIEEQKKMLASLGGDAPYIGVYDLKMGDQPYMPVSISLKAGSGAALTGSVTYLIHNNATLDAQGQIADSLEGPVLMLRQTYSGNDNSMANLARAMAEPLQIRISEKSANGLKLTAYSSATRAYTLVRADEAYRTKQKQALVDGMKNGMKFRVAHPVRNQQANGLLEMKIDPASKITGTVPQEAPGVYRVNAEIVGDLKEEHGHLVLATQITDGLLGNRFRAVFVANFTAWQTDQGWIGVTTQYPTHSVGSRGYLDIAEVK